MFFCFDRGKKHVFCCDQGGKSCFLLWQGRQIMFFLLWAVLKIMFFRCGQGGKTCFFVMSSEKKPRFSYDQWGKTCFFVVTGRKIMFSLHKLPLNQQNQAYGWVVQVCDRLMLVLWVRFPGGTFFFPKNLEIFHHQKVRSSFAGKCIWWWKQMVWMQGEICDSQEASPFET